MEQVAALVVDVEVEGGPDGFDSDRFSEAGSHLPLKPSPGIWMARETATGYSFSFIPRDEDC